MTPEAPKSVFANVDQDAMISRLETADVDEEGTHFLAELVGGPREGADVAFDAGVRVLGGDVTRTEGSDEAERPAPELALPVAPSAPVTVVGSIADDPQARRAFIMFGPAGISRPR